jgi:MATE family multidrug resistance protein
MESQQQPLLRISSSHQYYFEEIKVLTIMAWPVAIQNLLSVLIQSVSVFSLGHISTENLAAISLASLLVNCSGSCVAQGLGSALDTLCSQSYTGSSDRFAIGKHLQRGIVLSFFVSLPISLLWWQAERILLSLGQDVEISRISGLFTRWMIPGLFPIFVNECIRKYLFAQGIMKPAMYVTFLAAILAVFLQWLLVWSPINIGAVGAPISTSIVNIFTPLVTILYTIFIEGGDHFKFDLKEAFHLKEITGIVYLATPGTIMVVSEWLCFEAAALAAGIIGTDSLAAQTIVINTGTFLWQIPFGLAIATTTRIGNSLGANNPAVAQCVAKSALIMSLVPAAINISILMIFRENWGFLFSNEPSVVKLVADILPLAALYQLSDTTGCIGGAAIRGCGLQKLGSVINIIGYYIIGVPLGMLLTFHFDFGLFGIWVGLTAGLCFVSTLQVILLFRMDWEEQAVAAFKRVGGYEAIEQEE